MSENFLFQNLLGLGIILAVFATIYSKSKGVSLLDAFKGKMAEKRDAMKHNINNRGGLL